MKFDDLDLDYDEDDEDLEGDDDPTFGADELDDDELDQAELEGMIDEAYREELDFNMVDGGFVDSEDLDEIGDLDEEDL